MKKLTLFLFGVFLFPVISLAQCPTAGFTLSQAACGGQAINITNTSSGAVSYKWDFCSGDFDSSATFSVYDSSNVPVISTPSGATPVIEGTNHYEFICNFGNGHITRVDYGSSFDNAPSITDIGNPFNLFSSPHGMVFIKEAGVWHALVNDFGGYVVKLDFSAGLDTTPTSGNVVTNTNLSNPRGIDITTDTAGNIYAAVANFGSASITILSFGNSINNAAVAGPAIAIPNIYRPMDVSLAHTCGNWYAFVCAYGSQDIHRVDFGNSLQNTPVNFPLIATMPTALGGISIVNENAKWELFTMGYGNGKLYMYSIGDVLSDTVATVTKNIFVSAQNPLGLKLIKDASEWYGFTASSSDNGFEKISFINSCSVNYDTSTSANPANIIYSTGGTYNIALEATDATGNVSYYSQPVTVNALPQSNLGFQNTCFGDTTSFTDSTTISTGGITGRYWDFGDGHNSSQLNPTNIYATPGSYTVTLSDTSDLGCISVSSKTVNITPRPVANFSVPSPVCAKTFLQFSDSSTISSGTITAWHWDFGNSDTSAISSPLYKYPSGGSFNVLLTVTSNSNCSASHSTNININDAPNAGFLITNTCIGDTVSFVDTSTINSGVINAWSWNFGDGDSSKTESPAHSYPASVNTYSVTLVATSTNGCHDTASSPVKVNHVPVSSFSFSPTTICEGNTVNLTDLSTVAGDTIYAWHWDFGDSSVSTLKNPKHTYSTPGSYTIVLTVFSQTSCSASSNQMVRVVKSPTAGFIYTSTCLGDSTSFSDISNPSFGTTITSWHWDFGDGDTSDLASPVHFFDSAGTYAVTLLVTDDIGCTNEFGESVSVHGLPVANFTGTGGCANSPDAFIDASISTDGTINAYFWTFGDPESGSADSSTDPGPSHTYNMQGTYSVSLLVTTMYGCSGAITLNTVIQQSSAANFSYLPSCEKEQTIFTNQDSQNSLDSLWNWSFGDNGGVSYIESPSHYYFQYGTYSVTLTVTSIGGCTNTITKQVAVKPDPVADFVTAPGCINTPYLFQDISQVASGSVERWHWTFGNGDSADVQFPQTTYQDTGDYIVSLSVISDTISGCTDFASKVIHVYPLPVANFNYSPLFGSPPLQVNFNDLSNDAAVYVWHFGDGDSSTDASPSHTFQDTGKFSITQIVYSAEGCIDSLTKVFYVIKPRLDIAVTSVSYQLINNLFKVSAEVANLGTRDISSYVMQASIQDGATIQESVNTLLPSGAQGIINYSFTAGFEISPEQNINYFCVRALSPNGENDDNPANNEKCSTLTNDFTVVQPYPNPFTDQLQLKFILPYKDNITIELFDMVGRKISTLYNDDAVAGGTSIEVSTAALENEIYFCRFTFRDQTLVYPIIKMSEKK